MRPYLVVIRGGRGAESDPRVTAGSWNQEWTRGQHGGDAFTTATAHVDVLNPRPVSGVRVFVGGSRTVTDRDAIAARMCELPDDAVVVTSRTHGASAAARRVALARGHQLEVWSALTERFASKEEAYFARDEELIRGADRLITFWDGASTGTAHELAYAQKVQKPVELVVLRSAARPGRLWAPHNPFPGGDAA
jgi:hypothetical protein